MHGFMAIHNATLKNGLVPTKSIMSRLLFKLDCQTWYQIKGKIQAFHHMVRYVNYQICI